MRLARLALSLVTFAIPAVGRAVPPVAQPALSADERTLRAVFLPISGPVLLDFFRRQTQTEVEPQRLEALLRQLADVKTATHQPALAEVITIGIPALAALRPAANALDDVEAAGRAKRCLQSIEGPSATPLLTATA